MKTKPARPQPSLPEAPVVTRTYDLARWIHERTASFPKHFRFGIGDRLQQECLSLLSALVTASFARDRVAPLLAASLALTRLRVLLRLAHEIHCLSQDQYVFAITPLEEIGGMIGGSGRCSTAAGRRR